MTPDETALVLTKASAFDQRTIGEADVMAWHSVLEDVPAEDALQAVSDHYRESTSRLWPADVRRLAGAIDYRRRGARRAQELAAQLPELPAAPADPERVKALVREVITALPVVESVRIYERAKARARKEHGRPEPEKRRPKTRLTGKENWPPPQTDDLAAFATRYLIDGYSAAEVSQRLSVSKRWCEKTLRRLGKT